MSPFRHTALSASLALVPPEVDDAVYDLVIATLVAVAGIRHGRSAVLRALTRRERDAVEALRVF